MGKTYPYLDSKFKDFIARQKIFFTASAAGTSRVNISPRSTDWLRVLGDNAVVYLDKTGSGNETSAHIVADGRMTIMFCAFEGLPRILRLYGTGTVIHRNSAEYENLLADCFRSDPPIGARQIIRLDFDLVQASCGFAVPLFEYVGERDTLTRWAVAKTPEGLEEYRREKNQTSLDGLPTGVFCEPE